MQISLAEFLEKVSKLRKPAEKVEAIKYNDTLPLRVILQGAFDPSVKWLLPEGTPPYKPNDLVDQQHVLIREVEKLRYYIEGFYPNLHQAKRETMFIELLERVDPEDAKLLVSIKDKKLPWPGITLAIVKEAMPDLIVEKKDEQQ